MINAMVFMIFMFILGFIALGFISGILYSLIKLFLKLLGWLITKYILKEQNDGRT